MSIELNNELVTQQLAQCIAQCCPENERFIIFLNGELGSGKTTFARFFISALGYHGLVKSPSYTLVETYSLLKYRILHLDLYRLQLPSELLEIGLYDEFDEAAIWLIEWPERALSFLPAPDLVCTFTLVASHRQLTLQAQTPSGHKLLAMHQAFCFFKY